MQRCSPVRSFRGGRIEQCKQKWFGYRAMRATSLVSALCALALGGCKQPSTDQAQQPSGGSTAATAPSGSEILIGATLPLTGSGARIGGFYKEGYDLAFEGASQNGGVSLAREKNHGPPTLPYGTRAPRTAALP